MKIAAAKISCLLGDPDANLLKVRDFSRRAEKAGAGLIVFPEIIDTGYSTPVIQANAASWTDGFVPELQEIARRNDEAMTNPRRDTRINVSFWSNNAAKTRPVA